MESKPFCNVLHLTFKYKTWVCRNKLLFVIDMNIRCGMIGTGTIFHQSQNVDVSTKVTKLKPYCVVGYNLQQQASILQIQT